CFNGSKNFSRRWRLRTALVRRAIISGNHKGKFRRISRCGQAASPRQRGKRRHLAECWGTKLEEYSQEKTANQSCAIHRTFLSFTDNFSREFHQRVRSGPRTFFALLLVSVFLTRPIPDQG